ncbi:MAG: hypothetical protein ACR2QF_02165 [Geminicoccaceae bacterium]
MNDKKRRQTKGWGPAVPSRIFQTASRLAALGVVLCFVTISGVALSAAQDLPRTDDELVTTIRDAIEARDYERFEELVFWEGAGKIKRRIVAFQIRRGLGREIESIAFEDFPEDGMDHVNEIEHLRVNMPVTHQIRVIYDEPPINNEGKLPTSVFLIGKQDGAYRIALVVRHIDDDDND